MKAAPGGIGGEPRTASRASAQPPAGDGYALLQELSRAAQRRGCVIILVVDEMQSAAASDLQELAVALQDLAIGDGLPLALLGAGLANTPDRAAGVTFFNCQPYTPVGKANSTQQTIVIATSPKLDLTHGAPGDPWSQRTRQSSGR